MGDSDDVKQKTTPGIYTPASIHIGKPTDTDTSLPYMSTTGLPVTTKSINHKLRRRSKRPTKTTGDENHAEFLDSHCKKSVSLLELHVAVPSECSSKSLKPDHGMRYVENYKYFLRQKGLRYQEIFGHTPRKPVGAKKTTPLINKTANCTSPVNLVTVQSDISSTAVSHTLPGLVTVDDLSKNTSTDSTNNQHINNDDQSQTTPCKPDTDTDTALSYHTDDEGYSTDISSQYLGHSGVVKRKHQKHRGKLGQVMTQKKLKELLETQEPLKLENYYNIYT